MRDICKFDSAVCNRSARPTFHTYLEHDWFFIQKSLHGTIAGQFVLLWLWKRGIAVESMELPNSVDVLFGGLSEEQRTTYWLRKGPNVKCIVGINTWFRDILQHCPNLEVLRSLDGRRFTTQDFISLRRNCPKLKTADIRWVENCAHDQISAFAGELLPNVETLGCFIGNLIFDDTILTIARNCPNLKEIRIYDNELITSSAITQLAKQCTKLQLINLAGCSGVCNEGVVEIATHCSQLTSINLKFLPITEESVLKLIELCCQLEQMTLDSAVVSEEVRMSADDKNIELVVLYEEEGNNFYFFDERDDENSLPGVELEQYYSDLCWDANNETSEEDFDEDDGAPYSDEEQWV